MASASHSCEICEYDYDTTTRSPKILSCSHSFCQTCLRELERTGKKSCPMCRKDWSHVNIDDLLTCYQLINSNVGGKSSEGQFNCCKSHQVEGVAYCQSCNEVACVKCLKEKHKKCDWITVDEKCEALKEAYKSNVRAHLSNIDKLASANKDNLGKVNAAISNLRKLEADLQGHAKFLAAHKKDAEKFAPECDDELTINEIEKKIVKAEDIKKEIIESETLQLLMADVLQKLTDNIADANATFSNFKKEDQQSPAPTELKDGGTWPISDRASSDAVLRMLNTTNIRPSCVRFSWTFSQQGELAKLKAALRSSNTKLELTLLYHASLLNQTDEERESVSQDVNRILDSLQSSATEPSTIGGDLDGETARRVAKMNLKELHLLVTNSNDAWVVLNLPQNKDKVRVWVAKSYDGGVWLSVLVKYCSTTIFYLPGLDSSDAVWLRGLFNRWTELNNRNYINYERCHLHFPGLAMDADGLLGILKDCEVKSNIHLPVRPKSARFTKEQMAARYRDLGCTVEFDQS